MLHPLVRLVAAQPQLLAEHASAYADLLADEVSVAASDLRRRLTWTLAAAAGLAVGVALIGVATLLWSALPAGSLNLPWVMAATPLLPLAFGLWALAQGRSKGGPESFAALRQQLAIDAVLLRRAGLE